MTDDIPATPPPRIRELPCPTCRRQVAWLPSSAHRPFCSERCRLIDLGAWASERYAIPSETPPDPGELEDH